MADAHDRAARRVAKILKGEYEPADSPDVRGAKGRAEVKSRAAEITKALRQLGGGPDPAFIVLPKSEHQRAKVRLEGLKTGLMDYNGNIAKPSTRKRR